MEKNLSEINKKENSNKTKTGKRIADSETDLIFRSFGLKKKKLNSNSSIQNNNIIIISNLIP